MVLLIIQTRLKWLKNNLIYGPNVNKKNFLLIFYYVKQFIAKILYLLISLAVFKVISFGSASDQANVLLLFKWLLLTMLFLYVVFSDILRFSNRLTRSPDRNILLSAPINEAIIYFSCLLERLFYRLPNFIVYFSISIFAYTWILRPPLASWLSDIFLTVNCLILALVIRSQFFIYFTKILFIKRKNFFYNLNRLKKIIGATFLIIFFAALARKGVVWLLTDDKSLSMLLNQTQPIIKRLALIGNKLRENQSLLLSLPGGWFLSWSRDFMSPSLSEWLRVMPFSFFPSIGIATWHFNKIMEGFSAVNSLVKLEYYQADFFKSTKESYLLGIEKKFAWLTNFKLFSQKSDKLPIANINPVKLLVTDFKLLFRKPSRTPLFLGLVISTSFIAGNAIFVFLKMGNLPVKNDFLIYMAFMLIAVVLSAMVTMPVMTIEAHGRQIDLLRLIPGAVLYITLVRLASWLVLQIIITSLLLLSIIFFNQLPFSQVFFIGILSNFITIGIVAINLITPLFFPKQDTSHEYQFVSKWAVRLSSALQSIYLAVFILAIKPLLFKFNHSFLLSSATFAFLLAIFTTITLLKLGPSYFERIDKRYKPI